MTKKPETTADDFKTEQVKGKADPVGDLVEPVKSEPLTLGPREPYPTGKPPARTWAQINGFEAA